MRVYVITVLVLTNVLAISAALRLPTNFPRCYDVGVGVTVDEFNSCIEVAANKSKVFMRKGLPELGIPGFEDLVIPEITVEQKTRAYSYGATLTNIHVDGLGGYILKNFKYDPKNNTYNFNILLPHLELYGDYYIYGKIFGEKVNQNGQFYVSLDESLVTGFFQNEFIYKRGKKYINVKDAIVNVKVGFAKGRFDNLFGENEVLNKATNSFLEESMNEILKGVLPTIETFVNDLVLSTAYKLSRKIPYNAIFPIYSQ